MIVSPFGERPVCPSGATPSIEEHQHPSDPFLNAGGRPRTTSSGTLGPVSARPGIGRTAVSASNDITIRPVIWRRYPGDDWAAYDQLPAIIRRRLFEHAYDPWSVNALILWRHYRRVHPTEQRAQRALLRYLDHCERLERHAFAGDYVRRHGYVLPHEAAKVAVLRYNASEASSP